MTSRSTIKTIEIDGYKANFVSGPTGWKLTIIGPDESGTKVILCEKENPTWYLPAFKKFALDWIANHKEERSNAPKTTGTETVSE